MRHRDQRPKRNNPRVKVIRSLGPDVIIRGNIQQIIEKYHTLADEADKNRDTVMHHTYMQHAEHYKRELNNAIA
jgi:hypothetical protein